MVWIAYNLIPKDYYIYTNFELYLDNVKKLGLYEILRPPTHKFVMMIDEIHTFIESRTSGKKINIETSKKINFQKRKRGLNVYGTSPIMSPTDKRFRITANFIVYAESREPKSKQDFIYHLYNKRRNTRDIYVIDYEYAEKYLFKLFDTYELIESYNSGLGEFQLAKESETLFKKILYEKYNIVINNSNHLKDITHDSLTTTLIDLEINLHWEKYVYQLIKRKYKK